MILKKGSSGEQVKVLQEFLGLEADGVFGPRTHEAVVQWQRDNGLKPDGIVGPKTMAQMLIATTDLSELVWDVPEGLFIRQRLLPPSEYLKGPTTKRWLFLHHTAGWNNPYGVIRDWAADQRGPVATEFVMGGQNIRATDHSYDGEVLQALPEGCFGWHLGIGVNEMHRNSVGIEMCCFGQLTPDGYYKFINGKRTWVPGNLGSYYTYVGIEADASQVVELPAPFRGYSYFHRYSDKQISRLKELILHIAARDNIDVRKGLPELIHAKGAAAFDVCDIKMAEATEGLWSHTNVRKDKVDVFPQPELIQMLLEL